MLPAPLLHPFGKVRAALNAFVFKYPARLVIISFVGIICLITLLLMQPWATHLPGHVHFKDALFTATSATTVTGLTSVNTATVWTFPAQIILMIAIQIGGLGLITLAAMLTVVVSRSLGVRGKVMAMNATSSNKLGDVGHLLRMVFSYVFAIEAVLALLLLPAFLRRGLEFHDAVWKSIFYSVSSFNNAGFSIDQGGLATYTHDYWVCSVLMLGVFAGALGFPVYLAITQCRLRVREWSLHVKLTVLTTILLAVSGTFFFGVVESKNPATLGGMPWGERWFNAFFFSINTRSGGFNLIDVNSLHPASQLVTEMLMFIGGGSASTAGGIKVTSFAVLLLAVITEVRGTESMQAFKRRIPPTTLRQAVSVLVMGVGMVLISVGWITFVTKVNLQDAFFEVVSAFSTCGLSVGVSAELPSEGLYILSTLMFAGHLGVITLPAMLAARHKRKQLYEYPESRPSIG